VVGAVSAAALADLRQRVRFLQSFAEAAAIAMDAQAREASDIDQHIAHVRAEFIQRSRSMAHEVNNPLAILKSYLGVLDDKVGRAEPVTHELMVLSEELDRIGNILAEFVGTAAPRPAATIDLNHVVDDVVALFRESRFLPPLVQMEAQLAPQPCWVAAVPDVLKQILVNLIKNAVEALPTGGQITVTSQNAVSRDGSWYCALRVRDNGPGMPASTRAQLFKPLASAKPGDNRGIGMSIVQGLVHKLGGHIACTSAASGTCFEVLVPAAPERSLSGTP
jgi:signal transduction histidine kinase